MYYLAGAILVAILLASVCRKLASRWMPNLFKEAQTEETIEAQGITGLKVRATTASVSVHSDSQDVIRIRSGRRVLRDVGKSKSCIRIERVGETLAVINTRFGEWVDITLHVPPGLYCDIVNKTGNIDAQGTFADMSIESVTGHVTLDNLCCSGDRLDIKLTTGSAHVSLQSLPRESLNLSVTTGNADLRLPPGAKATVAMLAKTGGVHTDYPLNSQRAIAGGTVSGELNGGGPAVNVNVVTGQATLRRYENREEQLLLRPAAAPDNDTLLRPVEGVHQTVDPALLLRPAACEEEAAGAAVKIPHPSPAPQAETLLQENRNA